MDGQSKIPINLIRASRRSSISNVNQFH